MPRTLERDALPALAQGFSLLGGGGGGMTWLLELALADSSLWPTQLYDLDELPADTPCLAIAYSGSTMLLAERLPGLAPFAPAIAALERWLGYPIPAMCALEAAGMNGLAAFPLAGVRKLVDADLMGRALPEFNQVSLLADGVSRLVAACSTGAGGVAIIDNARADDVESLLRTAITCAGGWAGVVLGGFTVGQLRAHGIRGTFARAEALGAGYIGARGGSLNMLCAAIGATPLGAGRVTEVEVDSADPRVLSIGVRDEDDDVLRLVARTEFLVFLRNGRVEAASPSIIVAIDATSHDILEVHQITLARQVALLALPAPDWWESTPQRRACVSPSRYGLAELEPAVPTGSGTAG